jgi:hypothetical protein
MAILTKLKAPNVAEATNTTYALRQTGAPLLHANLGTGTGKRATPANGPPRKIQIMRATNSACNHHFLYPPAMPVVIPS